MGKEMSDAKGLTEETKKKKHHILSGIKYPCVKTVVSGAQPQSPQLLVELLAPSGPQLFHL